MQAPIPTVRLIVINEDGQVLLLRRSGSEYGSGQWCLPGGKVDYGDTVAKTVSKELLEETSLTCEHAEFLFLQDSLPMQPGKMHCINLYYECRATGELTLNDESSESAWIGPRDLGRYDIVFRNDEGLKKYWRSREP